MVDFAKKYMSSIEGGGGLVSSLGTAAKGVGKDIAGKFSRKSIVSAALPGDDIISVLGRRALGGGKDKDDNVKKKELAGSVTQVTKAVQEGSAKEMSILKSIAQNSMSLPGIARDVNVLRQNMQKLVKIEGGEKKTGADEFFKTQDQREADLEAQTGGPEKVVEKEAGDAKSGGGIFGMIRAIGNGIKAALKKIFSKAMLKKVLKGALNVGKRAFLPVTIVLGLFKFFTDAIEDYKETGSLKSAIMAGLGGILKFLTFGFFGRETLENIYGKIETFFNPIFNKISEIFNSFKNFIIETLNKVLPDDMQIKSGPDQTIDTDSVPTPPAIDADISEEEIKENIQSAETPTKEEIKENIQSAETPTTEETGAVNVSYSPSNLERSSPVSSENNIDQDAVVNELKVGVQQLRDSPNKQQGIMDMMGNLSQKFSGFKGQESTLESRAENVQQTNDSLTNMFKNFGSSMNTPTTSDTYNMKPVEVPPPEPSSGSQMNQKSSQLSESQRMESVPDIGDMMNRIINNNSQGSTGGGGKGKPADVYDSTLNKALGVAI